MQTFLSKPDLSEQVFTDSLKRRYTEHKNNEERNETSPEEWYLRTILLSFAYFFITIILSSHWPWNTVHYLHNVVLLHEEKGEYSDADKLACMQDGFWLYVDGYAHHKRIMRMQRKEEITKSLFLSRYIIIDKFSIVSTEGNIDIDRKYRLENKENLYFG